MACRPSCRLDRVGGRCCLWKALLFWVQSAPPLPFGLLVLGCSISACFCSGTVISRMLWPSCLNLSFSLCSVLMSPQCAFARSAPWAHWPRQAQGVAVERGADDVKPVGGIRRACIHRGRRAFQATPSGRCCSYALGFCVQKCSAFHQAICCRISPAHR